jgi:hypothetical protein
MTTRTDDDLERLLRSTLDSHAATVSTGPAWTGTPGRPAQRHWIAPLVAATLVVAVVGAYLVAHTRRSTPPASPRPDFTSFAVVGYPVTSRLTYADRRSVLVRTAHGPRYGDVAVDVWSPGGYERLPLQHKRAVTISGHRGYAGVSGYEESRHKTRPIRDVIWQFAPKRWAVVQQMGNLKRVPTMAELVAVARAVRPSTVVAQTTPFRLTALPTGFPFDHVEVQPSAGVLLLMLETPRHRTLTLTAGPANEPSDKGGDVTLRHDGTQLDIFGSQLHGAPTPADRAAMRFIARHLVWDTTDLRFIVP